MSIETALPYSWLRQVSTDVAHLDSSPLFGTAPPFPWNAYAKALEEFLHVPGLELIPTNTEWRSCDTLAIGFGDEPILHAFSVPPLEGFVYFLLPQVDLKTLLEIILGSTPDLNTQELDEFYEFITIEAIQALQKIPMDSDLSIQLLRETALPECSCLCIDIDIKTAVRTLHGRLLFTPEMQKALQAKYVSTKLTYPKEFSETIRLTLHLVAGSIKLSQEEWKAAATGDSIILDSCTITPNDPNGRVVLTLNGTPLFRGKLKDGNIKILEYPLLQEVKVTMENDEEDFDEEFETEEESFMQEESVMETEEEFLPEDTVAEEPKEESSPEPTPLPLTKIEEIPLTISIEVGRIEMSLKQLTELAPGNLLELNIRPESGVDLVVSGRCVGKGELLKIGESLGVRILDKV